MQKEQFAVEPYVTADEVKQIRKKLGLTQKEFAQLIGSSKPTIERWETSNGKITGPLVLLIRMLNENRLMLNGCGFQSRHCRFECGICIKMRFVR